MKSDLKYSFVAFKSISQLTLQIRVLFYMLDQKITVFEIVRLEAVVLESEETNRVAGVTFNMRQVLLDPVLGWDFE